MEIDKRGRLEEEVFAYQATKDGKVIIHWMGRPVRTIRGDEAARLLRRLEGVSEHEIQLALAKATGNFKRGNERQGGRR